MVELATLDERLSFEYKRGQVTALTFSSDGKALVSGHQDTTGLVWDLTGRLDKSAASAQPLSLSELDNCWADLAGDSAKAYRAGRRLALHPAQAVPYLGARLRPVIAVDERIINRLIADLDSEAFTMRRDATKGLEEFQEGGLSFYHKALASKPSAEMRRRLGTLVDQYSARNLSPIRLRMLRALEVLELSASPEAREVLKSLARGGPDARLTHEAKASLERLSKQ